MNSYLDSSIALNMTAKRRNRTLQTEKAAASLSAEKTLIPQNAAATYQCLLRGGCAAACGANASS